MKKKILLLAVLAPALVVAAVVFFQRPAVPEVRFAMLSGDSVSTSDLRGRVVLVNFWATYCAPYIKELPKMVQTYKKYSPRGYEMIAVAVSKDQPDREGRIVKRYVGEPEWGELHAILEKL
jgi:thiol-disulfide isomerase/thioredoxin